MNKTLLPSSSALPSSSIPISRVVFIVLVACCALHSTGHTLRAELSTEERETRDHQLRHLSRLVDLETTEIPAKSALLGMLILRDDAPAKTAGCSRATSAATTSELEEHVLACPRCREIAEVVRRGRALPTLRARAPGLATVERFRRSARLVDDGFGYLPSAEALGSRLPAALDLLREVLRESPDYADALQLYAVLKQLVGETAVAERAFKKAINLYPEASAALHNVALLNMREGLYPHARHILEYAMSRNARYDCARLLAWLHRFPESRHLVSAKDALRLMEMVVREERSPEKRFEDHRYLTALRAEVSSPWAVRPARTAASSHVRTPWGRR